MWSPAINQNAKKARALTGSTFGIDSRFRSGLRTKQEPVYVLTLFNGTVLITVKCVSVLQTNTAFYFLEAAMLYTGSAHIEKKRNRVCNQYTRQDCPMGITEKSLQYYKNNYTYKYSIGLFGNLKYKCIMYTLTLV